MTSSNVLMIWDKGKRQILSFKMLEPENIWHIFKAFASKITEKKVPATDLFTN